MNQTRKNGTTLHIKPVVLGALLAAFLLPAASQASLTLVSARRFPGSACIYDTGDGVLRITSDGAVYNDSSTDSVTVDCPVLGYFGGGSAPTELWYLDQSASALSCTYRSDDSSSSASASQTFNTTGDDNFYRKLTFNFTRLDDAYSHIQCTIPPRDSSGNASFIVGYSGY